VNERIFKMLNSVFFNALDILTHSVWRRMAEDSVFVSRQRPEIFLFVCLFVASVPAVWHIQLPIKWAQKFLLLC